VRPPITKVGNGKLTLTGISSHTGDTIVQEGTLQVDGQFNRRPVAKYRQFGHGQWGTLSGNGVLAGTVTINPGGIFSPGASVGRLSVGTCKSLLGDKHHGDSQVCWHE